MRDWTIVFDLDGTLVDTAPDLVAATNHVLADSGLQPIDAPTLLKYVGYGARMMIEQALLARARVPDPADVDRQLELFLTYYTDNIAAGSRPFPDTVTVLRELEARGVRLAVCTNKSEALSRKLLDALGLKAMFAAIAGRDTFAHCKPHPDHLLNTIAAAGGDARRAIMVGDSSVDVATAKAARVPVIAVTFGYSDTPAESFGADAVISHYRDLAGALAPLMPAAA